MKEALHRLSYELEPVTLPPAEWSAWPEPNQKRPAPKHSFALLESFPEAVHGARVSVPVNVERDQLAVKEWNRHPRLSELERLSDRLALDRWTAATPEHLYLYNLEASLNRVARQPSEWSALLCVESPRVAALMSTAFSGRPNQIIVARKWFSKYPEAARVRERLGAVEGAVGEAVHERLDTGAELPAKKPPLPIWANPSRLPKLVTHGGPLPQ